jgi:radical SAM protein with 4Fe4S-binding SPASM domain
MDIFEKVSAEEITERTKTNLIRKSTFVDEVSFNSSGIPLPSWIDISITELCNRVCTFCPRVNAELYPNQNLHLSIELATKVASDLKSFNYSGGIVFCGYGEPLLHPNLYSLISAFNGLHLEIVTNGDKLNSAKIYKLFEAGLTFLCVSMYDGPHQEEYYHSMFRDAGIATDRYILRDRWHKEIDSFGLKLTNRSGVVDFGPDPRQFNKRPCFYTAYSMTVDWNGDILLCVQDWNKKVRLGNLGNQSVLEVWTSVIMHRHRRRLLVGDRSNSPCNNCNADGTFHGFNHVNAWAQVDNG